MESEIVKILITAVVTGGVSTLSTIIGLRVHISYLRENIDRHEKSITRAHGRIDELKHCVRSGASV